MPEGPEIRRVAQQLHRALAGHQAEHVDVHIGDRAAVQGLAGREVLRVESRGKALLTHFEGGASIYSHNQLYGRWYLRKRDSWPRSSRQIRLEIHTSDHSALLFSASEIEVLPTPALHEHRFLSKLGPDLLDTQREGFELRLANPRFARRSLGALLLDQGFIAGMGNYLRSEMLYFAEVAPARRPKELGDFERQQLAASMACIGRRALRFRGVTNPPDFVRKLKGEGYTRREYRHAVFGRDGQPCYRCGTTIERLESAGRRIYVCPSCQH